MRLAEALSDSADRAAVGARVEEVGRLDHRSLVVREAAQDRLRGEGFLGSGAPRVEERAEAEAPPVRLVLERRRRGTAFLEPALLGRDLLAERADVDEIVALGSEAHRALAEEERSFADCARLRRECPGRPHQRATIAQPLGPADCYG